MRQMPPELAAHLASGTTTLCRCWQILCLDGTQLGFTDHDMMLHFDTIAHEPDSGFTASQMPSSLGLAVDTADVLGALNSAHLQPQDILAGRYDSAQIRVFLVNWQDVSQRVLLYTGILGEITRQGQSFTAEVRGQAYRLDQEQGRIYSAMCDAQLGDQRCGVALQQPAFSAQVHVRATQGARRFQLMGADAIPQTHLSAGRLQWLTGQNIGQTAQIRRDQTLETERWIELWHAPIHTVLAGDTALIQVGCDKTWHSCRARFANTINFRGCPHMPGTDFALSYAKGSASS